MGKKNMEHLQHVRRLMSDLDFKVTDEVASLASDLEARDTEQGAIRTDVTALLERIAAIAGSELAQEVGEVITERETLYGDAGFALGYFTRANPDWLIFRDSTD